MAERRMFAKTIIDSDAFIDMPLSTQALYFHLSMRADDDGFINNPKKIQRMIGASDDDLKVLVMKRFILPFDSGVVVIKHWKIHNYIRNDRYKQTIYKDEMAMLQIKENGAYTEVDALGIPTVNQPVYQMDTQDRLGKVSKEIVEVRYIEAPSEEPQEQTKPKKKSFVAPTLEEIQAYCRERKNNVDAKRFFDYFAASNWVDSKGNKVRNWKQKVITWEGHSNPGVRRVETEADPELDGIF
jgi:hypothetical protein